MLIGACNPDARCQPTIHVSRFGNAWTAIKSDPKVMWLGLAQSGFEGAMYTFVFMWTPALMSPENKDLYVGGLGLGPPQPASFPLPPSDLFPVMDKNCDFRNSFGGRMGLPWAAFALPQSVC